MASVLRREPLFIDINYLLYVTHIVYKYKYLYSEFIWTYSFEEVLSQY